MIVDIKHEFKKLEKDIEFLLTFIRKDLEAGLLRKEFSSIQKSDLEDLVSKLNQKDFEKYSQLVSEQKTKKNSNRERAYLSEMDERLKELTSLKKAVKEIIDFHLETKIKIISTSLNKDIEFHSISFIPDFIINLDTKIQLIGKTINILSPILKMNNPYYDALRDLDLSDIMKIYNNELEMDIVQNAYVEQWKKEVLAEEEKELLKKAEEKVKLIAKNNQGILFMLYTLKENISEKMISMAKSLYHLEAMVDGFSI